MIDTSKVLNDVISNRARNSLLTIEGKMRSGEISTSSDLVVAIEEAWKSVGDVVLETSVSLPEYRKGNLPIRKDLEEPLFQCVNDLEVLAAVWEELRNRYQNIYNSQRAETEGMQELIRQTQNKVSGLQLFTSDSESLFQWSSESFTSQDNLDTLQTTASIYNGAATLKVLNLQNINSSIESLTIDKNSSVGVPGCNLVINKWGAPSNPEVSDEPQVQLIWDTDTHASVSSMFDGNTTTWFEWESVTLPKTQKVKKQGAAMVVDEAGTATDITKETKGYGWKKFIQWPGDTAWDSGVDGKGLPIVFFDSLRKVSLTFTLKLAAPTRISTIQITPAVIGGTYPFISSILVSRDNEKWETVATDVYLTEKLNESLRSQRQGFPERNYAGVGIWNTADREIQYIKFSLSSDKTYIPTSKFGHLFYYRIVSKHKSGGWLTKGKDWTETERLPNENAGIISQPTPSTNGMIAGTIIGGVLGSLGGPIGSALGGIMGGASIVGSLLDPMISTLFGGKVTVTSEEHGSAYDIFDGTRQVVAIRDIELSKRTYSEESQIITSEHIFGTTVKNISLISTEEVPEDWDVTEEWIQFYISSDGFNWNKIIPLNRTKGYNDVIELNSNKAYVKVVLKRPTDRQGETPILKHFALKGLV